MDTNSNYQPNRYSPRSHKTFTLLSIVMGFLGLASSCLFFTSFLFGSLAILFGLLSKGRDNKFSGYSVTGIMSGALGMVSAITLMISSIYYIYTNPNVYNQFNRTYEQIYGESFEDSLEQFQIPNPFNFDSSQQ